MSTNITNQQASGSSCTLVGIPGTISLTIGPTSIAIRGGLFSYLEVTRAQSIRWIPVA